LYNFIIVIVSTYYILCVSWIIKYLIIIDARCKHEECQQNFRIYDVATLHTLRK